MAEPTWWESVPVGYVWDPLANGSTDWELIASEPPAPEPGGTYARDDATETLIGDIPYVKKYDARRKMLGYAYADTGSPWALHRVNPLPHPEERHLRCVTADIAGYNPWAVEQPDTSTAGGYPAPYLDPAPAAGTILLPRIPTYSRARCTLKFKPHPYLFLEDSYMVSEALPEVFRNTAFFDAMDPVLDVILSDAANPFLKWAETSAGGPTVGDPITAQLPEYVQKANLVAIWYHVPESFIVDIDGGYYLPTKIMDAMGKVNSSTWYSFPAGTLRMETPRFRKSVQAVIRTDPAQNKIPYVFDVVLPFTYVNPTPAVGSPIYQGWNLFPYGPNGKWYSIERNSGDPYFPGYDFNKIFEHVLKP